MGVYLRTQTPADYTRNCEHLKDFIPFYCKQENVLNILRRENNLQKAVCLLYNMSKEYNLEFATKKTKVFGFVGTDHLRTKIIINDETPEEVSQYILSRLQYDLPIFQ